MEEPNPRDELRERFKADLKRPYSEIYYSEDELLAIFDSAGDAYDDYLRQEVLIVGARLFPDSQAMLERRAIFYRQTDAPSFAGFMEDHPDIDSPLMNVMKIGAFTGPKDEAVAMLDRFLEENTFDDDELVIQFVQAVHALGLDKWLIDNVGRLRAKVEYLPTLLYEIAVTAEDADLLRPLALKCLEELTELEPYTADYWTLLAEFYLRDDRTDDAATALDYALAIEPDNVEAMKTRLRILDAEKDIDRVRAIIDRLVQLDPSDPEIIALSVARAFDSDDLQAIYSAIAAIPADAMPSRGLVFKAIELDYPKLGELLENLYTAGVNDPADWRAMADVAFRLGRYDSINLIMETYNKVAGEALNHDFLLYRLLYHMKRYDVAIDMYQKADESGTLRDSANLFMAYAMYLLMLLRSGHTDVGLRAAKSILEIVDSDADLPGSELERYGTACLARDVIDRIENNRPTDWAIYDPLGLDKQ